MKIGAGSSVWQTVGRLVMHVVALTVGRLVGDWVGLMAAWKADEMAESSGCGKGEHSATDVIVKGKYINGRGN